MRRSLPLLVGPVLAALSFAPSSARAWNSKCTVYPDPTLDGAELAKVAGTVCHDAPLVGATVGEPGPWTAQGRYRSDDKQDEHAAIFRRGVSLAGIPAKVLETQRLTVFAFDKPASAAAGSLASTLKSIAPVSFTNTNHLRTRAFAIDELAMLPDFSYSLWDWAQGNETCPLAGYEADGAIACHLFDTHMGMANANHFPPQADRTWARLHGIAIAKAKECAAARAKIPTTEHARFAAYLEACDVEALAIEAVSQHYMQDTWSTGHMWERWGAADVDRYPDPGAALFAGATSPKDRSRYTARVVGAIAGIVHGMEPAFGNEDAMCFPYPEVSFWPYMSSSPIRGAGDVHLEDKLRTDATFLGHDVKLMACAAASVREVYDALGPAPAFGPATGSVTASLAACVGHRVTNAAFDRGLGIDAVGGSVTGWVPLLSVLFPTTATVIEAGAEIAAGWKLDLSADGIDRLNYDLAHLAYVAAMRAKDAPEANDVSTLDLTLDGEPVRPTMLGTARNSQWLPGASEPLAKYQDPELPWPGSKDAITPDALARAASLGGVFHRGHVADHCAMSLPALETLTLNATGASTPTEREAKCEACTEMVARHLRVGTGASSYATNAEPVCHYLAGASTGFVYEPAAGSITSPRALARKWCGCGGVAAALTDAGWQDVVLAGSTVTAAGAPIASTPSGTQPRDAVVTSDGRAIVSHANGTLVVLDLAARKELDTDDDPATTTAGAPTGVTRLKPTTGARGIAIAESKGREYALVVSSATDEIVVVDVSKGSKTYPICKRFDVGLDAAKNEDAWDVVVMPDQKKAYVSFRGFTSSPSDTIAVLDLAKATDCASTGGEVAKHLKGIFGAKAGIGAMALDPAAKRLAITARRSGTCTATVRTARFGSTTVDMAVGCDSVILLDTATDAVLPVPTPTGYFSTLPAHYPYALAWLPDGSKLAYAMFQGPDPWPQYAGVTSVGAGGAVRLGDPAAGASYNVAVKGIVVGESLLATTDWLYVGTTSGDITALPTTSAFWNDAKADPEISLHGTAWYGGCHDGAGGVPNPAACATAVNLGSPIRAMLRY